MRKRLCGIVLVALFLLTAGVAFGEGKVTIAGSNWPVWDLARGMDALKLSPEVALQARSYDNSIELFLSKKADGVFINLYDYMTLSRDAAVADNTAVILVTDYSNGGDVIVVRPDIQSAKDLAGKTVGVQVNSLSLYLLNLALAKDGASLKDVKLQDVKGENIDKAFAKSPAFSAVVGLEPLHCRGHRRRRQEAGRQQPVQGPDRGRAGGVEGLPGQEQGRLRGVPQGLVQGHER